MDRRRRIALYGGTFDPVHLGHLAIASQVSQLFEIDQLLFVPAKQAPHKANTQVTAGLHRYAMLALATQDQPRFIISRFELQASATGYTLDTLSHFQNEVGGAADLFFVMGADSWSEITTWHKWRQVLAMTNHIVVTRPGFALAPRLPESLATEVIDLRGAEAGQIAMAVRDREGTKIFFTDAVMLDIAATDIRQAVQAGSARLEELVPPAVANYILKYGLYQNSNEEQFNH